MHLPYLRASLLESARLWPTTPVILRQAREATNWDGRAAPAGTGFMIFASLFHRDETRLPYAHHFAPQLWLQGDACRAAPFVPFSDGPATCPARNLVQLLASLMLRALLLRADFRLTRPKGLLPSRLPMTLNPFGLRFSLSDRPANAETS